MTTHPKHLSHLFATPYHQVNKGEAERCRDLGAKALRDGNYSRAVKLLGKSLQLYPLPGVEALLGQARSKLSEDNGGDSTSGGGNGASASASSASAPPPSYSRAASTASVSSSATSASASAGTGAGGRSYTEAQEQIVKEVLKSKEGGRGAHYRVLGIAEDANEAQIKKAYRKLALKLHPDKNSAPHSDEAFKAVGLAYATLSDSQKRTIYDRYGEEDPDNRGGGGGPGGMRGGFPGGVHFNGQAVDPDEIFRAFFGGQAGGMGGMGGPGFRVYTSGFGGPGFAFHAGGMPRQRRAGGQQAQQEEQSSGGFVQLLQLLPLLVLFMLSFFNSGDSATGNKYFSLTPTQPYVNQLFTKLVPVKDIPYYVDDRFLRTYNRDRYQLAQVERMVEKTYHNYLVNECNNQATYKKRLEKDAREKTGVTEEERNRLLRRAEEFELSRCTELENLFPPGWQNDARRKVSF